MQQGAIWIIGLHIYSLYCFGGLGILIAIEKYIFIS